MGIRSKVGVVPWCDDVLYQRSQYISVGLLLREYQQAHQIRSTYIGISLTQRAPWYLGSPVVEYVVRVWCHQLFS